MSQARLDLSRIFELEPHGPDTYVGESPRYDWSRIYGGLVVAQALRAAVHTVKPEHCVHSLHAYFILGGDLAEPVRYEVDRVRNGRSFTTRRVVARQSAGAILTLECSFQRLEDGPDTQSADMPAGVPAPATLTPIWDAGIERADFARTATTPSSMTWARFPNLLRREGLTGGAQPEQSGELLRREGLTGGAQPEQSGELLRREGLTGGAQPEQSGELLRREGLTGGAQPEQSGELLRREGLTGGAQPEQSGELLRREGLTGGAQPEQSGELLRREGLTGGAQPEQSGELLRREGLTGGAQPEQSGELLRREGLTGGAQPEQSGGQLGADAALHACALAYLSDMNAMDAIVASRAGGPKPGEAWGGEWMGVSIDHAIWFHRPVRADDWLLLDFSGHGLIRTRGLATGQVFDRSGVHVATIAQEGLLRTRKPA